MPDERLGEKIHAHLLAEGDDDDTLEKDVKKFEWLLEKLNIVYKPRPAFWERIERKKHMARLTDLWCQEYKDHLLSQLKSENLSKQPEFLREKAKTIE